jgi:hypothetical protein
MRPALEDFPLDRPNKGLEGLTCVRRAGQRLHVAQDHTAGSVCPRGLPRPIRTRQRGQRTPACGPSHESGDGCRKARDWNRIRIDA